MQFNGKLVTIILVALGLGMASFAWWFQFSRGQRALAYWQGENAAVIRHGTAAELLVLQAPSEQSQGEGEQWLLIDGSKVRIVQRVRLNDAPGFVHARHALIDDGSYQWEQAAAGEVSWSHALEFENEAGRQVTVLISLPGGYLRPIEGERALVMSEKLQRGLRVFFQEQLQQEE
jgi:hypothetical protein